ncbi:glycosyl hydrolase [Paenibacillus sp. HB172176]|uniref:glycosyl hydrolase n=1 Tax=Paenibacillus sp. HB172176 TaxID=2493690 RepID=UPI00143A1283|nr:glycosyl hydrolase [Paenibacillus sp. HB172176]
MLYPNKPFDMKLFRHPTSEYRGAPFWAWNKKLDKEQVLGQIDQFPTMGMGGFQIHTRVGLDTEYLGPEYMELVKLCVEQAKKQGLLVWLYDEDRWPSGYGGGFVTEQAEHRSKYMVWTPFKQGEREIKPGHFDSCAAVTSNGKGTFLAAFRVRLDDDGYLEGYALCGEETVASAGETVWRAYLETGEDSPWFNNQAYVDTLSKDAIRRFIEVTHERYFEEVGDEFGRTIPAIFTDEPQFPHKQFLGYGDAKQEVLVPYTADFNQTFLQEYGYSLLAHLPELFWERKDGEVSVIRYHYHNHIAERFAEAFADQIGSWCEEHGIMLCGHMMEEPTLHSQTKALGEAMRSLRSFHLPGIDMLCDQREYSTAKQAQSIAHQYGRPGVLSELYGVTNWDFDFRKHKLQGDWMAALGVTVRVPHLTWMSMGGEAKRDYPASIGLQSPWYEKYPLIEDHFARINTVMTRGTALVKVGIIHPVESYWLYYGPNNHTNLIREQLETNFKNVTEWLLFGMIDYDYISESLIPSLASDAKLGEMEYDIILVPGCKTIRRTTLAFLKRAKELGKKIVFAGEPPKLVDARIDAEAEYLAESCTRVPLSKNELLLELEDHRIIDIRYDGPKFLKKPNHKKNWDGERSDKYIYQLRCEGDERWLLIANGKAEVNPDLVLEDHLLITIKGMWKAELLDTFTGSKSLLEAGYKDGNTVLKRKLYSHDSLLLHLMPVETASVDSADETSDAGQTELEAASCLYEKELFETPVELRLEEDNVLLLDMADYRLNSGSWQGREEILRIDNLCRAIAGYPERKAALAQPWAQKEQRDGAYTLELKFIVHSEFVCEDARLAMENFDQTDVCVNGRWLTKKKAGFYVDSSIETCDLPPLQAGANILILKMPFERKTNVENAYILGSFLVETSGARSKLVPAQAGGHFGFLNNQGMPFYGGNATYAFDLELEKGVYELQMTKFRAPLLEVYVNGESVGEIMFSPYSLRFEAAEQGVQRIEIKAYGNRINTFGTLHNCDEREVYFDPNAWRTVQDGWSYEYQLKDTGIGKAPVLRFLRQ